jgi:hypothetical protein
MYLHRCLRNEKDSRNIVVGQPLPHQFEDLDLAWRERLDANLSARPSSEVDARPARQVKIIGIPQGGYMTRERRGIA